MEDFDPVKKEMSKWSHEVKERYYFEVKLNNFLKSEIQRLENEVLRLRNENSELKMRIQNIYHPELQKERVNHELEID